MNLAGKPADDGGVRGGPLGSIFLVLEASAR